MQYFAASDYFFFSKNLNYDNNNNNANYNINALFSFDCFMVYIPECKQQLRTMK